MASHPLVAGTVQAYVNDALFFSQNHKIEMQPANLDQVIFKVVELAEPKLKRREVRVELPELPSTVVEMDRVLIQRLLGNVLSNAIEASAPGSTIRLELQRLAADDASREWIRVRVIDHGAGISRENLQRITSAYFTTKDSGDENRGFGLGLTIVQKIVSLHAGSVTVDSTPGCGSTFTIDLPSEPPTATPALPARTIAA